MTMKDSNFAIELLASHKGLDVNKLTQEKVDLVNEIEALKIKKSTPEYFVLIDLTASVDALQFKRDRLLHEISELALCKLGIEDLDDY